MSEIQFARGKQANQGSNSLVDGKVSFTRDDRILYIDYLENGEVKREPVQSLTVNGHTVDCNVPSNAKFTDTTYNVFSSSNSGLVPSPGSSDSDKILSGAGNWRNESVSVSSDDTYIPLEES